MDTHTLVVGKYELMFGNLFALSNCLSVQLPGLRAQTLKMCMWYDNVLN